MVEEDLSSPQRMIRLSMSFIPARAIYAAVKLGVADQIDPAGSTAKDLAARLGVDAAALERVLRTLSSIGVLCRDDADRYVLTPLGETLRNDSPESVRDYTIYAHEFLYDLFGGLVGSVQSGKSAVEQTFGAPLFTYLEEDRTKAALLHAGLGNRNRIEAPAILAAYHFEGCRRVIDLGEGNGAFLSTILAAHPELTGMLLELGPAAEAARAGQGGPLPRCKIVEGDYFQTVPAGGDLYMLKRILLGHTTEETLQILRNCRSVMDAHSRLLIIEGFAAPANEPNFGHLMDLTYLVATSGRMRTPQEYSQLLQSAGLRSNRFLPTNSDVSVLEAVPL